MSSKKVVYGVVIGLVLLICVAPLANLFKLGIANFSAELFTPSIYKSALNTFWVALFTTIGSLIIGTAAAYFVNRTNLLFKKRLKTLLLYPYIIPPYLFAIGWIILANPTVGVINQYLPIFNVYTITGIVFVECLFMYTFVFLNVNNALENMDGSLEESARMCGAKPVKIFFTITLPLLKNTLIGSAMIVFLATVSSFGVPAMIGGPGKVFVLTTKIYQLVKIGTPLAISKAVVLSLPIIIMAFVLLYFAERLLNRKSYKTLTGKHNRKLEINLRGFRVPAAIMFLGFIFISIVFPFATIFITSLMPVFGDWSLSLINYTSVLLDPRGITLLAIRNSLILAMIGSLVIAFLSFFVAYYNSKTRFKFRNLLSSAASLPYATPGTILAIAMIFSFDWMSAIVVLGLAYIIKYLSYGIKIMTPALAAVDNSMEEASLMSGASWPTTLKKIWFPIMKGSFTTTCFLAFAPLFSELTMSVLFTGPDTPTVGARLFQLQEYESPNQAAVLGVMILVLVMGLNFTVKKLSKGKLGI